MAYPAWIEANSGPSATGGLPDPATTRTFGEASWDNSSVTAFRRAAIVMWFYAAGFGLSTIPVAIYLRQRGRLPSFFGLFEMYGGPWSTRLLNDAFLLRLIAFFVLMLIVAFVAWLTWNGSKLGAFLSLALLPIEVVFWIGFALPIPWLLGAARLALVLVGLKTFAKNA